MKPYGKLAIIHYNCGCCQMRSSPRADAKIELRKIVEEESYDRSICSVCNGEDDPRCVECC